jgi:hypothetical protein
MGAFSKPATPDATGAVSNELLVVVLGIALAAAYLFRDSFFGKSSSPKVPTANGHAKKSDSKSDADPRDFVAKMIEAVSLVLLTKIESFWVSFLPPNSIVFSSLLIRLQFYCYFPQCSLIFFS